MKKLKTVPSYLVAWYHPKSCKKYEWIEVGAGWNAYCFITLWRAEQGLLIKGGQDTHCRACRMSFWSRGDLLLEIFLGHMKGLARWEAICKCWTIWTSWSSLEICMIVLDISRTIFCWNSLKYCSVNSDMAKSQVTFSFGFRLDSADNWVSFVDIFSSPLIISVSV